MVRVVRHAVDRVVSGTDALFQDHTIGLEAFAEEAIVSKEVHVVEGIDTSRSKQTSLRD